MRVCQGRLVGGAAGSQVSCCRSSYRLTAEEHSSSSSSSLLTSACVVFLYSEQWRPEPPVDCRCSWSSCWNVPPSTWTRTVWCGKTASPTVCSASPWPCIGSCSPWTRRCKSRRQKAHFLQNMHLCSLSRLSWSLWKPLLYVQKIQRRKDVLFGVKSQTMHLTFINSNLREGSKLECLSHK